MTSANKNYCSVPQCRTYYTKNEVSMHFFPKEPQLKQLWAQKLKIRKQISKYMCVCSKHFTRNDYLTTHINRKQFLKKNAIPSQNLPRTSDDVPKQITDAQSEMHPMQDAIQGFKLKDVSIQVDVADLALHKEIGIQVTPDPLYREIGCEDHTINAKSILLDFVKVEIQDIEML